MEIIIIIIIIISEAIVIAPAGRMRKTLAFQIHLCLDPNYVLIIVSPLMNLSWQHAANPARQTKIHHDDMATLYEIFL
jgi:hypothetical protein